ncbi:50S ribosomal protein L2 [Candidatus Saccharibacteria bacterium]|jgi:large subunit ribosomal protein L2|nr:50S ribosomal protein L2 [Candidatus Saccharibacteria bacterium]
MAIKTYKPTTPARRGMTTASRDGLHKGRPVKSLTSIKKSNAGRNNQGRITVRHRGSGVKRLYRDVSMKLPDNFEGTVERLEYDPNRSAHIALVKDNTGKFSYIVASSTMKAGQKITSGTEATISNGNRLPLSEIPAGTTIYAIEMQPGKGAQMVRSAGTKAQLMAKEGDYAQVRLPSGEIRKFRLECSAAIGAVGNEQHQNIKYGSAGRKRRLGWRPSVKGRAMNAADHPMGGGDGGKGSLGGHPKTPWGQKALGLKTRRNKRNQSLIVRNRHQAKRK